MNKCELCVNRFDCKFSDPCKKDSARLHHLKMVTSEKGMVTTSVFYRRPTGKPFTRVIPEYILNKVYDNLKSRKDIGKKGEVDFTYLHDRKRDLHIIAVTHWKDNYSRKLAKKIVVGRWTLGVNNKDRRGWWFYEGSNKL